MNYPNYAPVIEGAHDQFNLYLVTKDFVYYITDFPDYDGVLMFTRLPGGETELKSDNFMAFDSLTEDREDNSIIEWMSDACRYDLEQLQLETLES